MSTIVLNVVITLRILVPEQHGFWPGKSTTTIRVSFASFISSNIKKGQAYVIMTDFSKVFDSVDHSLHIRELMFIGILFLFFLYSTLYTFFYLVSHYKRTLINVLIGSLISALLSILTSVKQFPFSGHLYLFTILAFLMDHSSNEYL